MSVKVHKTCMTGDLCQFFLCVNLIIYLSKAILTHFSSSQFLAYSVKKSPPSHCQYLMGVNEITYAQFLFLDIFFFKPILNPFFFFRKILTAKPISSDRNSFSPHTLSVGLYENICYSVRERTNAFAVIVDSTGYLSHVFRK